MSSHPKLPPVGDQELALLHFVNDHQPATVAQAVEGFGYPRGLARSTVLTMMERLRRKGYLTRRVIDGVYRYATRAEPSAAVRRAVQTFVDRTLGGTVSPFVAYLVEHERLSDEDVAELEALLSRLQKSRRKR
jgi:predicted transcriptional regulator